METLPHSNETISLLDKGRKVQLKNTEAQKILDFLKNKPPCYPEEIELELFDSMPPSVREVLLKLSKAGYIEISKYENSP